jgi:uncharacterized protein YggE
MNALLRTIACAACGVLLSPAVAGAQQATVPPAGITVVGNGTATVTEWVQEVNLRFTPAVGAAATAYDACTRQIAALGETIHAMGLPASAMLASATVYSSTFTVGTTDGAATPVAVARVQVPSADVARFVAAASKSGWKATMKLVPRDAAAAKDSAYRAAYADAHARAEVLASADGRHIGRLLNVTPGIGDYFGSMMSSLTSFVEAFGKGSGAFAAGPPEVSESATFTFELTP